MKISCGEKSPTTDISKINEQEFYIQMANLSSGSSFASNTSQTRSSFRTSNGGGGDSEPTKSNNLGQNNQPALYNFPWDFKLKSNPIMVQIQTNMSQNANVNSPNSTLNSQQPPPLPSVPPPTTPKLTNDIATKSNNSTLNERVDETEDQYCAPWDLKLQEEMLKMMALNQSKTTTGAEKTSPKSESITSSDASKSLRRNESTNSNGANSKPPVPAKPNLSSNDLNSNNNNTNQTNKTLDRSESPNNDYNIPWETKQCILFQSMSNNSSKSISTPLTGSSVASALTTQPLNTHNTPSINAVSSIFNKLSLNRLSTRSNNSSSSSSSRRSSTSSISTNSPPLHASSNTGGGLMPPPTTIPPPPNIPPPLPPTMNSNHSSSAHLSMSSQSNSTLTNQSSASSLQLAALIDQQRSTMQQQQLLPHQSPQFGAHLHQQQQQQQQQQLLANCSNIFAPVSISCNCSAISSSGSTVSHKCFPISSTTMSNNSMHGFECGSNGAGSTMNSTLLLDNNDLTNPIMRQNRAGSSHHFPLSQFQTVSSTSSINSKNQQQQQQQLMSGDIQVAVPLTALFFSQSGSLPSNMLTLSMQQQHQISQQIASCQISQLECHSWFHGRITRKQAEVMLANRPIGSFLVRQSESGNSNDCSLSLISGSGCVHMRICIKNGEFILGQCSQPFNSIVKMIEHYANVEVPIKGAQHVKLTVPVPRP